MADSAAYPFTNTTVNIFILPLVLSIY